MICAVHKNASNMTWKRWSCFCNYFYFEFDNAIVTPMNILGKSSFNKSVKLFCSSRQTGKKKGENHLPAFYSVASCFRREFQAAVP